MRAILLLCAAALSLAACAESIVAPPQDVARAAYSFDGPTTVTLKTVIRTRSGEGGHSSLMINGSERVIFDPAGTWWHPRSPEVNDVHYGISPWMEKFYVDYHVRPAWHMIIQTVEVSPAVAEQMIASIESYGAVPKAQCGLSVSSVLNRTPGFESVGRYWFPNKIMEDFAELPGVTTRVVYDGDPEYSGFAIDRSPDGT